MAGRLAAMLEGTPVAAALAQLGRQSTPDVRLESQLAPDRARIGSCPRPAGAVAPPSFSSGSVPAVPALPESCQRSAHCDGSTQGFGVESTMNRLPTDDRFMNSQSKFPSQTPAPRPVPLEARPREWACPCNGAGST